MRLIQNLLHEAFPLMALAGLLLAGYGLLTTPDEVRTEMKFQRLTAKYTPSSNALSLLTTD